MEEGKMKKYDVSFVFILEDEQDGITPELMLEKDNEDGGDLGFRITNIKIRRRDNVKC
jgi:hypothetical protein